MAVRGYLIHGQNAVFRPTRLTQKIGRALRSRVPVHQSSTYFLGQTGGSENCVLTVNQIPAHSHSPQGATGGGSSNSPGGNVWANWTGSQFSDQPINGTMNAGELD